MEKLYYNFNIAQFSYKLSSIKNLTFELFTEFSSEQRKPEQLDKKKFKRWWISHYLTLVITTREKKKIITAFLRNRLFQSSLISSTSKTYVKIINEWTYYLINFHFKHELFEKSWRCFAEFLSGFSGK